MSKALTKLALIGTVSLLAACAGPEKRCENMGATPGTSDYWQCVQAEQNLDAQRAMAAAAILSSMPQYQPAPVYQLAPVYQPATPWHATCYRAGAFLNCNGN